MFYQLALLFTYFILYAMIGWACEVVFCSIPKKKFINRGFLNGPYCPIYGVGALIIVILLAPYIHHPIEVFLVGMISTSVLEYITSWGMERIFHAKWWDYSKKKFNINGRVCLKNSLLFGVMSLALMYLVHPFVAGLIMSFSEFWLIVIALIAAFIFFSDVIESTRETLVFNKKLGTVYEATTEMKDHFKKQGINTAHDLSQKVRTFKTDTVNAAKDSAHQVVVLFENKVGEKKKLNRYSHRRIMNAFPNMKHTAHQDSLEVYKACLASEKECKNTCAQKNNPLT